MAPVNFMSNLQLDKVAEEMQCDPPIYLPSADAPNRPTAKVFKVTELAPVPIGDEPESAGALRKRRRRQ